MHTRRTFFETALSAIALGATVVLPFKLGQSAEGAPLREPPVSGKDPAEHWKLDFDDYFAMVEAAIAYVAATDATVFPCDRLDVTPPRLGYFVAPADPTACGTLFSIGMPDLARSLDAEEHNQELPGPVETEGPFAGMATKRPSKAFIVREFLKTAEGKAKLAVVIEGTGKNRAKEIA